MIFLNLELEKIVNATTKTQYAHASDHSNYDTVQLEILV